MNLIIYKNVSSAVFTFDEIIMHGAVIDFSSSLFSTTCTHSLSEINQGEREVCYVKYVFFS